MSNPISFESSDGRSLPALQTKQASVVNAPISISEAGSVFLVITESGAYRFISDKSFHIAHSVSNNDSPVTATVSDGFIFKNTPEWRPIQAGQRVAFLSVAGEGAGTVYVEKQQDKA